MLCSHNDLVPGPGRDSRSRKYRFLGSPGLCTKFKHLGPSAFLNVQRDDAGRLVKLWLEPKGGNGQVCHRVSGKPMGCAPANTLYFHAGRLSTVDGVVVDGGLRTAKDIQEVGCTHRYSTQ
jgi:hypothetical protein